MHFGYHPQTVEEKIHNEPRRPMTLSEALQFWWLRNGDPIKGLLWLAFFAGILFLLASGDSGGVDVWEDRPELGLF